MSRRRARWVLAAAVSVGGAAWVGGARKALADPPRVAVAPVAGEHASPEVKDRVGRSLAEGLLASGADVAASPADAPYILRGRVEVDGRSYTLHLEMLDRRTGMIVASREDRCEICTEGEAFETASAAASTLKAQVFKRQGGAASAGGSAPSANRTSAGVPPAAGPTGLPAPPPAAASPSVSGGPLNVELRRTPPAPAAHRAFGWASVAAGVASAGVGAVLVGVDGRVTCNGPDTCPDVYQTRWGGVALIGAGVVAVGAGLLALFGKL